MKCLCCPYRCLPVYCKSVCRSCWSAHNATLHWWGSHRLKQPYALAFRHHTHWFWFITSIPLPWLHSAIHLFDLHLHPMAAYIFTLLYYQNTSCTNTKILWIKFGTTYLEPSFLPCRLSGYGFINVGLPPASPSESEDDVVMVYSHWNGI